VLSCSIRFEIFYNVALKQKICFYRTYQFCSKGTSFPFEYSISKEKYPDY